VFVVYGSFFPFDFTADPAVVRAHASRIVLRPFEANGKRAFSIPDVASNLLLGVPAGLLLVAGGVVGRSLDVLSMTVGAALGAALAERYRPRRRAVSGPTATVSDFGH